MTDNAIENAKSLKKKAISQIERLEGELRFWRDRLNMADHFIDQWNAFASGEAVDSGGNVSGKENKKDPTQIRNRKVIRNSKKEDVAAAARELIIEHGQPIMRDELYSQLIAQGYVIEGKDPKMVLSTMLWRMRGMIARLDNGYWPADLPNEENGYDPEKNRDLDTVLSAEVGPVNNEDVDSELPEDARGIV